MTDGGVSVLTLNSLKDVALGYSLKSIWNMINILQFVVFINEIKMSLPVHAEIYLKKLRKIALGEFIPY